MTPKEQRIAIAEVCGYQFDAKKNCWQSPVGDLVHYGDLPNYLEDLNAMASAEDTLSIDQEYVYGETLAAMIRKPENILAGDKPDKKFPLNGWGYFCLANATASMRAKAFLQTLGKIEE